MIENVLNHVYGSWTMVDFLVPLKLVGSLEIWSGPLKICSGPLIFRPGDPVVPAVKS